MTDTGVIDQFLAVFTRYIDSGFGLLGGEVAFMTTLLAVGSSAGVSSGDDAIARALTQGVSGGVNAFGQDLVEKGLDVAPRLTIRPGFVFRVIVARDLVLEPYGEK